MRWLDGWMDGWMGEGEDKRARMRGCLEGK